MTKLTIQKYNDLIIIDDFILTSRYEIKIDNITFYIIAKIGDGIHQQFTWFVGNLNTDKVYAMTSSIHFEKVVDKMNSFIDQKLKLRCQPLNLIVL